jgi:hypothetical protein
MSQRVLSFDVGTKNLALCDLQTDATGSFEVFDWSVNSCVQRGVNVNKTPVSELAPFFYKYAKEHVHAWFFNKDGSKKPIHRVLIENQPLGGRGAARNLKTKVLSHILQCICLEESPDTPVTFIHPSLKLKDMPKPVDRKSTYRENKLYAIQKATDYVTSGSCKSLDVCKEKYTDKKMKKDDLADAFLQGYLAAWASSRGDILEPASDDKPKKKKVKQVESTESPQVGQKRPFDTKEDDASAKPSKKPKLSRKTAVQSLNESI